MMNKLSRMRLLRLVSGKTLDEISMISGLDRGLLSRAERGLYCLTPDQKKKIAVAFGVSEKLVFGVDQ